MHFERIEMIGFKSFAEKSVFTFQPGIASIIGPNGCGKSNIVDALRWVLGEQSAKNMRGESMEDVIFIGSEARKATGMAEVTLYLKDMAGQLPPGLSEYDEISITRRLYRSGESEYLINKVPCRLKDIKDLFLDTGLEAKSYSIIEQGKIGQILNSKPADRRFLIEETAGVMKYKARRTEASNKLELASQNLLRIKDITGEVERQINSLKRQVSKAERYKKIRDEIKDLELRILAIDYKGFGLELSEVNNRLEKVKEDLAGARANISKGETGIETRRINLLEVEKEIGSLQERLLQAEKDIGHKEKEISLIRSDISSMKEREEKNKKEIETLTLEEETLKEQLKGIEEKGNNFEREIGGKEEEILHKEDQLSELENQFSATDESLEETKTELFENVSRISDSRNRITHLETLNDGLSRKKVTGEDEINALGKELEDKENTLRGMLESLERCKKEREDQEQERIKTTEEIQANEKALALKEEEFFRKKDALTEKTARLNSLKEVEAGLDGYHEGLKSILIESQNDPGIYGLVADILETSPEYEPAIEAALGQRLQHIVIKDHKTILKTIDRLKTDNSGRGTFIPLEPRVVKSEPINANGTGVIGEALSLVKCRNGYQRVLEALLSDTVVVTNLSTALDMWRLNGISKTIVTLEGDVIDPSGSVTGGSASLNGGGILKKKREIKQLEEETRIIRGELSSIEEGSSKVSKDLDVLKKKEQDLRSRTEGLDKELFTIEKDIAIVHGDRDRLLKRTEILKTEEEQIEKETKDTDGDLLNWKENLDILNRDKEQLEEKIKTLNEELKDRRDAFEDLRAELMDIKLDLATLKEKKDGNIRDKERFRALHKRGEERILTLREEIDEVIRKIKESENSIKETEGSLNLTLKERAQDNERVTRSKDVQTGLYKEIEVLEQSLRKDREALDAIQTEEGETEIKKTELTVKLEHIVQTLRNNYNLTIEEVISGAGETAIERADADEKLNHLKERLESLGAVNLAAIEEYNELKERYDFLSTQQTDLIQSIDSLRDAIAKIDRTTEQRLRDAFILLNERFQEVFRMLFEGGRSELILEGGDILNSGIDIIAQPPGKKLQNISLLSGGEKALTAIALLFASFLVKPSPLCLLDEVDAPLDDTNIDRFASILKMLAEKTQFIVITHNKRTMEAANVLYGITMEEPGVSKVISVRMNWDREPQMALKE